MFCQSPQTWHGLIFSPLLPIAKNLEASKYFLDFVFRSA